MNNIKHIAQKAMKNTRVFNELWNNEITLPGDYFLEKKYVETFNYKIIFIRDKKTNCVLYRIMYTRNRFDLFNDLKEEFLENAFKQYKAFLGWYLKNKNFTPYNFGVAFASNLKRRISDIYFCKEYALSNEVVEKIIRYYAKYMFKNNETDVENFVKGYIDKIKMIKIKKKKI